MRRGSARARNTLCSSPAAPVYSLMSFLVSLLPSPMKFSQFLISHVSVGEFFSSNGRSRSSSNRDASAAIPIDTIKAYLTTILVVVLIPPIVYLYAQILFPSPMTIVPTTKRGGRGSGGEKVPPPSFVSEQRRRAADKWWRLAIAVSSVDRLVSHQSALQLRLICASYAASLRCVCRSIPTDRRKRWRGFSIIHREGRRCPT